MQYILKYVADKIEGEESGVQETTLLGRAEKLMDQADLTGKLNFFFYAGKGTERANLLTYTEAEYQKDYNYELYYLRRCYEENYLYFEDDKQREREIFSVVKNIIWGISPEEAVCIACPEMDTGDFVYYRVTEVPQYQNLYDRLADIFSLKDMFEDVREPLLTLAEVRRMELKKQQKTREDRMNKALFLLSLMGRLMIYVFAVLFESGKK